MPRSHPPKPRAPRRRWPLAEKRRIVELTLREGASVRAIAREHGVDPTSLCQWRSRYRAGDLVARPASRGAASAAFLPVTIEAGVRPCSSRGGPGASVVQITLASGASVRIETERLDIEAVCALIGQLQR
jgi:transposase-like protein